MSLIITYIYSFFLKIEPTIVNAKGKWGQTPLMLVILNKSKANHVAETDIRSLLEAGADINLCDDDGTTPLMLAIKTAKFHIVDLLLANGANSGLADNCGRTALHHAVALEMPEIVEALLKTAVDVRNYNFYFRIYIKLLLQYYV